MKSEGSQPDSGTFVCCLKACGSVGYLQKGQEIHVEVVIEGLENDFLVGNSLVDMYAKCGWLVEAHEIFDELPKQDVVSWTALIGGYAEHGHHAEGLSCFQEMQLKGISPDVVSWNNLILGYSGQADCESAHKSYAQMQEQGFLPNKVTITNHLKACGTTADLQIGQRLVAQVYGEAGVDSVEIIMANAVVDMYGRCGSMGNARKAFNEMTRRERVTWNCLIAGYARQGECETVFELFATMVVEERVQPNEITFLAVLIACNHAGLVQKGKMYFNMMLDDYGLEQTIMHYNCMIDLFGRAGLLDDLVMLLHSMPLEPNDVTWITVLSASQKWSNMTLGRHAFDQLMSGGERNTAALVTMANIYANGHMWDQAKKIEVMTLWRELCAEIS
jgi:pentatricopeptide repeat protein